MGDWQHGTFGCFDNCGICIITWLLPCYRVGKIAEALGDSCCIYTILSLIPLLNIFIMMGQRGRIREKQGIDGDTLGDLLCICCCTFCALAQEGQECESMGGAMAMDIERA